MRPETWPTSNPASRNPVPRYWLKPVPVPSRLPLDFRGFSRHTDESTWAPRAKQEKGIQMSTVEEESHSLAGPASSSVSSERRQRRQMLIALAMLLLALILVLIKDRQYFFPSSS